MLKEKKQQDLKMKRTVFLSKEVGYKLNMTDKALGAPFIH